MHSEHTISAPKAPNKCEDNLRRNFVLFLIFREKAENKLIK